MPTPKFWQNSGLLTCGLLLSGTTLLVSSLSLAEAASSDQVARAIVGSDSGAQINQTRAYLAEQALRKRLEEEQKNRGANQVETPAVAEDAKKKVEVKFILQEINFTASQVLKPGELEALKGPYLHREINLDQLYELVGKVNELYQQKGYVVCRAFLPAQTITKGVATITLIEGKTGQIEVANNKSTRTGYITSRINLKKGQVSNLKDLNNSLLWFNGTNDVQLRIKLQAGKEPGTTDYVLTALEPKRSQGYVLIDTAGNQSTGILREGLGWYTRSLTGNRDTLMISGLHSDGTNSGSLSYETPISKSGTKLNLQYQANRVDIKSGDLADLEVKGHSTYYSIGFSQPLSITSKSRVYAGLDWSHQNSQTDFMGTSWIDDKLSKWTANINFTRYGDNVVWYHRHGFSKGSWENIAGDNKDYFIYSLNFLRQQMFKSRKIFTIKLNGQYANEDYLASADQFYIGGINSVRGYKESILSGDSGFSLSAELSVPDRSSTEWVFFADGGSVFGGSAFDDHTLYSVGAGYRLRMGNWLTSSLMLGLPFKTELNGTDYGHYRLHFSLNALF